ncbi:MAG: AAA family ATPase [Proteobacteria bacterium]|nr:AAA family ATPase [Pseudomonadota bacterium]
MGTALEPDLTPEQGQTLAQGLCAALQAAEGGPVQHLQTHLSHLLLTPSHAYKLKKPLRLPFADFSTLALRRHFCAEELRLNQRLAPRLYLDMLPVLGSVQRPRLGRAQDAPAAIDWVLRMRRFAAGSELDALLRAGRVQGQELDAFALRLAQFHAQAPVAPPDSDWGRPARVGQAIADVLDQLAALLSGADGARLAVLRAWFDARRPALAEQWAARRAAGQVREGHGDLHLGNLVRLEGAITAFDCLEFSPALRWIDTLADTGFLTMDLHAHGRPDLAWRFLDAYLAASGDHGGLAVLRPYEVYRALVRALAARLRAAQGASAQGPDYLACAERLAAPMAPRLLITYGLSGSGKSTVAAALLQQGAVRLRSDVERKRLFGLAPLADSAAQGLDIYTPEASRRTFALLAERARTLLQAGYPVIVDAAFLHRRERADFRALAHALGLPFAILHCHAAPDSLRARVQTRQAAGVDPSEAGLAVLARQQQLAEPLAPQELAHTLDLATDGAWDAAALYRRWLATTVAPGP